MNFSFIKEKWNLFVQVGAWILTVLGTFIVQPPLLNLAAEHKIDAFTKFLIASFVALLFIPLRKRSIKKFYPFWYKVAIVLFALSVFSIAAYSKLLNDWSVKFYNSKVLVIGSNMYPEAKEFKKKLALKLNRHHVDDETFVKARQGLTYSIWPKQELQNRFYIIAVFYMLCIAITGSFIITVIQSIYCYESKK